ncbi:DHA2 family efflux MFS transporter permease subunit [Streptomyces sp. SID8366]|uniref:MFS transporter n=1 Tax=unclassified Streptomyces TaxID=2593676 RepID=UPI000DB90752|nr:MFS transporter [Streptomyces sp. PsTaAH-130]MYU04845.1 DHA2 family efflux MFS transporter permease subunit [Streptomyces sp. SID8366]MYU61908.1 DHA2 family efflux MFS transporter permease subunit [Streptomyces sp. SID69]RAJ48755.1 EmrB/QacA subfamily drug resistance transporter [Streptomyces sp. PsTaAH-130]
MSTVTRSDTTTARPSRAAWTVLIAMTGGLAMIMLDQTVVTVALPTMTRDLPLSAGGQQWVVNSYVLAMAATVALGGKLGSKLGPVTTFRVGIWIFFLTSALCGLAPAGSIGQGWLIGARVAQGCGAALMMPVSASIVIAAFPSDMRGRAMGVYSGISQLFLALGPLLGGTLTEWVSWRAVFWLNVPVGVAALVLIRRARPANPRQPALSVSVPHALLLMAAVGTTVYALQQSSSWSWGSARTLSVLATGVVLSGVFVMTQLRSRDPLVKLRLLRHRGFNGNVVVLFATQFSMIGLVLYSSLYAQNLLGYGPVRAGFASLSFIVPLMVAAQISGRWYDRSGPRAPLLTGLALAAAGTLVWALTLTRIDYWANVPGSVMVGFGLGLVFSPVNTDALSRVPSADRPQASGIIQTVRQLGGTLGVAVIGTVVLDQLNRVVSPADRLHHAAEAMRGGYLTAAAVFGAGLLAGAFLLAKGKPDMDD